MKWSNQYTVFDVENALGYTLFVVMFPTNFSITALNIDYITIGGYMYIKHFSNRPKVLLYSLSAVSYETFCVVKLLASSPRPSIEVWEKRWPGLHCNSVSMHALAITKLSGNCILM